MVIRRGARSLGLKTDASYRFERGMDVEATMPAMKMALLLLARSQGRQADAGLFPGCLSPAAATGCASAWTRIIRGRLTGIAIAAETSAAILERLGFTLQDEGGRWQVQAPSHRVDVTCKQDLVEEIIRIHGYEHLRGEMPLSANPLLRVDREREIVQRLKNQLVDVGFNEVINYVFQSPEENALFDPLPPAAVPEESFGERFFA